MSYIWLLPLVLAVRLSWQGFQFVNQTFIDAQNNNEWDFDVEEIRALLDSDDTS
jgi:hypothetical protein